MKTENHTTGAAAPPPLPRRFARDLELVVRQEVSILSAVYHVTVAELAPVRVKEAFDLTSRSGLEVTAKDAVVVLARKGYRIADPLVFHGTYATARLVRGELAPVAVDLSEATPVQLNQAIVTGARALTARIHRIDSPEGAAEILAVLDGLILAAQELHGVAAHLEKDEAAPLAGEWAAVTEGREHGFDPDGGQ